MFPSKHGTLHFCRHKTGRKHHVRQCFQFPYVEDTAIYSVPMPVAKKEYQVHSRIAGASVGIRVVPLHGDSFQSAVAAW